MKIKWLDKPTKHDYSAAATYLSLTMDREAAKAISKQLENAEMTEFEAKDILRDCLKSPEQANYDDAKAGPGRVPTVA